MAYALGAVKPNVRQCAEEVGAKFAVTSILGVGARANVSDHPKGLALDFMCDVSKGRQILAHLKANWSHYGLKYLIHEQKIYESPSDPGTLMENRGSLTANHFDHVHASFNNVAVSGGAVDSFTSGDATVWVDLDGDGLEDTTGRPMTEMPQGTPPVVDLVPDWAKGIVAAFTFLTDKSNWWRAFLFVSGLLLIGIVVASLMKRGIIGGR